MVGGLIRHFTMLRRTLNEREEHEHLKVGALLEEAENHRVHLLIWSEFIKQNLFERLLLVSVQLICSQYYFYVYNFFGKYFSHRLVGYLGELSVESYGEMLELIESGKVENLRVESKLAKDYWNLCDGQSRDGQLLRDGEGGKDDSVTLKDIIVIMRMEEMKHREFNHFYLFINNQQTQTQAIINQTLQKSKKLYNDNNEDNAINNFLKNENFRNGKLKFGSYLQKEDEKFKREQQQLNENELINRLKRKEKESGKENLKKKMK
ncbi:hypothetical protein ABK040_000468 [Willaertia magna]